MSNTKLSVEEISEYFNHYDVSELKNLPHDSESVKAYMTINGIMVFMSRSFKKDEYTKLKTKTISFCIPYEDLLNAFCFVNFLDEKLYSVLTKLRDEVK
jgi:hypothetical protein